jgi:flagellar hook-basal body complex protein FliE
VNINSDYINSLTRVGFNESHGEAIVEDKGVDFKEVFTKALDQVNAKQVEADQLTRDFIAGEVDDLHTVMIATEEARLSLELAVQVRNKCIEAYKEISNMQL